MEFLYFFLLLLGLARAYTDPKCLQVDIAFSISTGNTAIPSYLNTTVRDFVKTIANAFSTPDEVPPGSRQFARFSFYTDSIGSDFMDYTRQQLNEKIEPTIACYDNCGDPDYSFYTLFSRLNNLDGYQDSPSLTTNRVGIIITDEILGGYSDAAILHQYPLIFAVGIPGVNGDMGRQNLTDLGIRIGGHPERAFPTIEAALDPETGIIAQISNRFTAPSVTCSGFGLFYNRYIPNPYDTYIQYAAQQMIYLLNKENNGFKLFPYSSSVFPSFYEMEGLEYVMINDFRLYSQMNFQTSKYWLQAMLRTLESGLYNNYGFLVFAETDFEQYMNESMPLAKKIAEYDVLIYVIDATLFFEDKQELFTILTRGIEGRIINTTDSGSAAELTSLLRDTFVKDFNNLGCEPIKFFGNPSAAPPMLYKNSKEMVGTCSNSNGASGPTWVYNGPTEEVQTPTVSGRPCSGIIFISEMTSYISFNDKIFTFDLIRELKRDASTDMLFAYGQYGNAIYRNLNLTNSATFEKDFSEVFSQYLSSNQPTGNENRLSDILSQLLSLLQENSSKNFVVLVIAESHAIYDPSAAMTVAQSISALGSNIYVLDYSDDSAENNMWETLTSSKPGHVLKAENMTLDQMTPFFVDHLVFDINNNNC